MMTAAIALLASASAGALEVSLPWGGTAAAPAAPALRAASVGLPLADIRDKCRATRAGLVLGGRRVALGFALDPDEPAGYLMFKPVDGEPGAALAVPGLSWAGGEATVLGRRLRAEPVVRLPWRKSRLVIKDEKGGVLASIGADAAIEEAFACGKRFELGGETHLALFGTAFPGASGPPRRWLLVFRQTKDDALRRVVTITHGQRKLAPGYSASLSQSEQLLISR